MKITKEKNNYKQDVSNSTKHIRLGSKHKGEYLLKEQIRYIEANECYTWFHLTDGTRQLSCKPIGYYEEELSDDGFVRIHRSYVINLSHLKSYESKYRLVYLKGETVLPVSFRKNRVISKKMVKTTSNIALKAAV
ncbi:LytTR family transcriptional regulator DNA-binding domain-containing protein [Kordia algicida OT-1]|uniref:Response regulator n=1 Tax=Kordia algicida OT-1 TaxID=391587 RepID=A9E9M0_9FLAO|nr:LytTR family transcriptional regulator DNA-binding domain-containing protein [Kordia algicida]EDP94685.1 response regulator [Kordia algicida OT-1]